MLGPLEGIKILEVANWVAAPAGCVILSDLGADVIKIEHPGHADPVRHVKLWKKEGSVNPLFEQVNRGKRSMSINLDTESGQAIVRGLADESDVLVTNLIPERQVRYGLTYEQVSASNPRIIYLGVTGYGTEGEEKNRLGYDYSAFWARSGIMATLGNDDEPPVNQRPGFGDFTTSMAVALALNTALYEREKSGQGQRIDVSLLHTGIWALACDFVTAARDRANVRRNSRMGAVNPMANYYLCGDSKWIQLNMGQSYRFWPRFVIALEIEDLENDPRFDTHEHRGQNNKELIALLQEQFKKRPRGEWISRLDEQRCIFSPVQTMDEVIEDRQIHANGFVATVEHPEDGSFEVVNAPFKLRRTPAQVRGLAPEPGQHTEEKLLEMGYSWEDITSLKEEGVIL